MKALALLSGGLDSMLASRLIMDQGIEVIGVSFSSPFFGSERGKRSARELEIDFRSYDISASYIGILKHPRYGFGKNCNPCTDCHHLMVAIAARRMEELEASFIITGEVVGQRRKSQTRDAMNAVARGTSSGLLLRPLSALLLDETIPEKEGWVDRSGLLGLSGRSRKEQFALAQKYDLKDYSSPGGGCLLTEAGYCRKLLELREEEGWTIPDLELLRVGRHFRVHPGVRVISGRDDRENQVLLKLGDDDDYLFQANRRPGSLIMLRFGGELSPEDINIAASICARYSKEKEEPIFQIDYWRGGERKEAQHIAVSPMSDQELDGLRI
ncbi:MAG: tRNA 4-thiouridine(8) synthase ThiI [Candidatus Auribacterota bacterium]|nr:tRNA 4-thiouridine(8) synthase ThiI [Candidatus Auribacterota bacterium]